MPRTAVASDALSVTCHYQFESWSTPLKLQLVVGVEQSLLRTCLAASLLSLLCSVIMLLQRTMLLQIIVEEPLSPASITVVTVVTCCNWWYLL